MPTSQIIPRFMEMMKQDPEATMRLLQLRMMKSHRNITNSALAEQMDVSTDRVSNVLSGIVWHEGRTESYMITRGSLFDWFDRLDDAISDITESRGGLLRTCGCSEDTLEDYRFAIKEGIRRDY